MAINKLDTTNFSNVELAAEAIAQEVGDLRASLKLSRTLALMHWVGEGRTGFENLFYVIDQQMKDISDEFWDMYSALVEIETSYMEADQAIATQINSAASEGTLLTNAKAVEKAVASGGTQYLD